MKIGEAASAADAFADAAAIPAWSKPAVNAVVAAGYMKGYLDNTFQPAQATLRAEVVALLDRAAGRLYSLPGTYGPEEGLEIISGNATITAGGVTLQNIIIEKDLYLTAGIGNGNVMLKNVTVKGQTIVGGGGEHTVTLRDCTLGSIRIDRQDGRVRIFAEGDTSVTLVILETGANLETSALVSDSNGFATVYIATGETIELVGNFNTVRIAAPGADVNIAADGSVNTLEVDEQASGTALVVGQGATVTTLQVDAPATVTGEGEVQTAVVNIEGVSLESTPTQLELAEGVTTTIGGKEVTTPSTPAPPVSGGSGGGGSGTVRVSAISVEGDVIAGSTLTAKAERQPNLTATYQWYRSQAEDKNGEYDKVGEDQDTYVLTSDDVGKWIKVEVKGTNRYTGTKTSDPVGPVLTRATEITSIVKPKATGAFDNTENVNDFMDELWGNDGVFSFTNGTLTINIANITAERLLFIETNWGGNSVPVELEVNGEAVIGLTKDANWDNAYLDWIGLDAEVNGEVKRVVPSSADNLNYSVKYEGGLEPATVIESIEKPVWSNEETPNAENVNAFMDELWADGTGVFSYAEGTLTVNIANITDEMLLFIETNWGGNSVPVQLDVGGQVAVGLTKDANWGNQYLDWLGLDVELNGTVGRIVPDSAAELSYTVKYIGGLVNKTALLAKVADVAELVEADYTTETWAQLQTALEAANTAIANEDATQEEVDEALSHLDGAIEDLVEIEEAALEAVNNYLLAYNYNDHYSEAPAVLEPHLAILGLDVGEDSAYNKLHPADGPNRKTAVFYDLSHENNIGEGYNPESLEETFDSIVMVRTATQESTGMVNSAVGEGLADLEYINVLQVAFEAATHTTHSDKTFEEKKQELTALLARYGLLTEDQKAEVRARIIGKEFLPALKNDDGTFKRSQYSIDALAVALTEVEAGSGSGI